MPKRGRGRLVWCQIGWFVSSFEGDLHTYLDWECGRVGEVVTIFEGIEKEDFVGESEKTVFVCRLNVIADQI